jgi:alanine-synthesizing transaminase
LADSRPESIQARRQLASSREGDIAAHELFKMTPEFHRIRRLPPYVFEEVNRIKARLRAEGVDIIDFGMGNPDMPTPKHIVNKLIETARDPKASRYSASRGIVGLRRAMAGYYGRRFGVKLDPEREVIATLGSKEGFANLAQALCAPGDVIICPNPAYPIHAYGFIMAGGVIRHVPALSPEEYLAGISRAVKHSAPPPSILIVSYPSNPTAQWVDLDFYREIVALAKKHEMMVLSDIAYSEIYFDDNPPPSILQVEGARDIAVEVNSLSKTFAMAGWRVGMVVGNERMCAALARVKSYLDYGAYTPIQVAAAAALNGPTDCIEDIRAIYRKRRDVLVTAMKRAGWDVPSPPASMFAWAPLPEQYKEAGSMLFSKLLIEEAGVAVAPGIAFGEYGEGYVRIGLVENEHRIRQAARNVKKFLSQSEEILGRAHNTLAAQ